MRIGLLGCGTIGSCVAQELLSAKYEGLELVKILVRDLSKDRQNLPQSLLTDKASEITENPDIDLVIETLGGEEPAKTHISNALKNNKHVVTANKELIAKHGKELFELAEKNKKALMLEASVGGGIPVISTIQSDLKANKIHEVVGILNGTTNYILTEMKNGKDFSEALREAQAKGYAEPDPTNDIEGFDAKYKISILASLAFGSYISPSKVTCKGIKEVCRRDFEFAKELGFAIKLVGRARRVHDKKLSIDVYPYLIPFLNPLSQIDGVLNCVSVKGNLVGSLMLVGAGAGAKPTSSSILGDVLAISTGKYSNFKSPYSNKSQTELSVFNDDLPENNFKFYLRLKVNDQVGVMRDIGAILAENGVSLEAIIQKQGEKQEEQGTYLILITHLVPEEQFVKSLKSIKKLDAIIEVSSLMKVLES